jgi:hypothetical protein
MPVFVDLLQATSLNQSSVVKVQKPELFSKHILLDTRVNRGFIQLMI